jgi:ADP-heptose:LPS heptosyltransferase
MSTPFVKDLTVHDGCHLPFDTKVDYLVGKGSAKILRSINTIPFDENIFHKKDLLGLLKLVWQIRKEKYDMIFVLDKHWIFGLFAYLCGIPKRFGFDRDREGIFLTKTIPYNNKEHEIDQYKKLITLIGKKPSPIRQIEMFAKTFNTVLPKKYVCIAPGGGNNVGEDSCIRRYPIRLFNRIVNKIKYPVVLVGGKEDHDLGQQIWRHNNIYNLIGATDLEETAYIMGQAEVIIVNDSGPMHIASAVNPNVISLFGPTNPARKAPLNKKSVAIWYDQDIYEPEYEFTGKLPSKNKVWFSDLSVEEVVQEIMRMYENSNY